MKTKTIVIGEKTTENKAKPIVFEKYFDDFEISDNIIYPPKDYNYIELICKDYAENLDLMFAYYAPNYRCDGILFFGKWNDGVVE